MADSDTQANACVFEHAATQCAPPSATQEQIHQELQSRDLAGFLEQIVPW